MEIREYPLPTYSSQIEMPRGTKILSVQDQGGLPTLWALVDPSKTPVNRMITAVSTGEYIHDTAPGPFELSELYIGTVQFNGMVWHFFDIGEKS